MNRIPTALALLMLLAVPWLIVHAAPPSEPKLYTATQMNDLIQSNMRLEGANDSLRAQLKDLEVNQHILDTYAQSLASTLRQNQILTLTLVRCGWSGPALQAQLGGDDVWWRRLYMLERTHEIKSLGCPKPKP